MSTPAARHTAVNSLKRHSVAAFLLASGVVGMLSCAEPVGIPAADDTALLQRFVATANPSRELIAAVKPLLATARGQEILAGLRSRERLAAPLFTHLGEPEYEVSSIAFSPDPTPTGTHPNLAHDDATTGLVPIGFNFRFFGTTYSAINISTNGFATFDAMNQAGFLSEPIPQPSFLNALIAAAWTDLEPDAAGRIWYGIAGVAPNRRFVLHYENVAYYPAGDGIRLNVQIKLFERTNVIEIHSLVVPPGGSPRTQGIENASGSHAYFVPGRVFSNFVLSNDAVRFTPPFVDDTPPTISATVTGTVGANDWYTSDVGISWTVADAESDLFEVTGCDALSITSDQAAATYTCAASSDGGSASESVTIKRDATAPVVSYAGNAGSYSVDQTVDITCSASDALSGLASTTCANVGGDAYAFGAGVTSVSATATDNAGNVGGASASFTVTVTAASLCNLVERWVTQKGVANSLCQHLSKGSYDTFRGLVETHSGKHVPADKAAILISLSNEL